MKILLIADTHCKNEAQTRSTIELIRPFAEDAAMILHAGDLVTTQVIDALQELSPIYAVHGNMDLIEVGGNCPDWRTVQVGAFRIGMTHGTGAPHGLLERVRARFADADVDAIVFGHTHEPFVDTIDGVLMINPGSPTDRRFTDHNSLAIVTVDDTIRAEIVDLPR